MRLILIRHTRPAVADNVCYGVTDADVAPTFEEDAARVVVTLPAVERLVTSPLRRCMRLAERIGAARGLVPVVDGRIWEMDFGRWERLPWSAIDRTELDAWAADFSHARPHGGESVAMVSKRVGSALADYRRSGVSHAVVTHAGIIKAALAEAGCADAWMTSAGFGDAVHIEFPAEPERSPSGPQLRPSIDGADTRACAAGAKGTKRRGIQYLRSQWRHRSLPPKAPTIRLT